MFSAQAISVFVIFLINAQLKEGTTGKDSKTGENLYKRILVN
jgi:hypothetical protein